MKNPPHEESLMSDYWYHLTVEDWGVKTTLTPQRSGINCGSDSEEQNLEPRICVAPSRAHCLAALPYSDMETNTLNVYRAKGTPTPADPDIIYDADITKEHWFLTPTEFTLVGTINIKSLLSHTVDDMDSESQREIINSYKDME